jgi:hypothetical protein
MVAGSLAGNPDRELTAENAEVAERRDRKILFFLCFSPALCELCGYVRFQLGFRPVLLEVQKALMRTSVENICTT